MVQNAASLMYGFVFVCFLLLIPCSSMLSMFACCHVLFGGLHRVVWFSSYQPKITYSPKSPMHRS